MAEETDDEGNQTILWLCHGTSLLRCAPHQVRPRVEDMGAVVPVDMKAALHDLQELRARSTTQFRDVMEPETGIEDLLEEEGLGDPGEPPPGDADSGYSATEPADDQDQDVLRGISDAANTSFMFQRLQDEDAEMTPAEHAGLTPAEHVGRARLASTMEPEPCPETPNGAPQEKRQRIDAEQQLEAAASTPVPEVGGDELLVEDAFIAEVHDDSLPADWVLIDGSFELDEAFLVSLGQRKNEASEKHMTPEEKELMLEAKRKELASYFNNNVLDIHRAWQGPSRPHSQCAMGAVLERAGWTAQARDVQKLALF